MHRHCRVSGPPDPVADLLRVVERQAVERGLLAGLERGRREATLNAFLRGVALGVLLSAAAVAFCAFGG